MINYSIINKSQLEGATRLDAEYYGVEYLKLWSILNKNKIVKLGNIAYITDGEHGSPELDELSNIKYFSSQHVREGTLEYSDIHHLSRVTDEKNSRSRLQKGNILLSIVGTVGKAALVTEKDLPGNTDRNVATIRIVDNSYTQEFILSFLISKYGQFQTLRECAGNVQPIIILSKIRELVIPVVKKVDEKKIADIFSQSIIEKNVSKILYQQAENLLLEELALKDFEQNNDLFSIVNLSEIKSVSRLDAEYFQTKYSLLSDKIRSQTHKQLGKIAKISKGFEPGSEAYQEEGKQFIRVSNLTKYGIVSGNQQFLSEDLYDELKPNFQPQVGEILLSKDASPGIAYALKEPIDGIISSGILRLKADKNIDPEYLTLVINSPVGQMQAKRDAGGSIIAHWKPDEIKKIIIPILPIKTQQKIADLVRRSHEARLKSAQLLEEAKRKVEELIEKA